jgi:hypothetical protein
LRRGVLERLFRNSQVDFERPLNGVVDCDELLAHGNSACWVDRLVMGVGYLLGGSGGAVVAFFVAAAMNFFTSPIWERIDNLFSTHPSNRKSHRRLGATRRRRWAWLGPVAVPGWHIQPRGHGLTLALRPL